MPLNRAALSHVYSVERKTSSTGSGFVPASETARDDFYVNDAAEMRRPNSQSRSFDDLSAYARMSGDSSASGRRSYENGRTDAGSYSYAYNFDVTLPRSASSRPAAARPKLVKTSSIPTVLDAYPNGLMAASGVNDDYVPASPPSAATDSQSGSFVGATVRFSDTTPSSPASDVASDVQSPSVVSPAAGISMSSRSRIFTRRK